VGAMPNVIFPHKPHTLWLECGNCHPAIFKMQKGANPISMVKIVNGEFCGRCHGRVAFPISNCNRCHVKPKG
jgi:c(7)-type cytochrome triheme protein